MAEFVNEDEKLLLYRGVGDIVPFSRQILEEAKMAFRVFDQGWQKMRALRQLFYICHTAGLVEHYLEVVEEALQEQALQSFRPDILFFAGSICEDFERYDEALAFYLRSIEFDCQRDWVRYSREANAAFCYLMKEDPFKAKEHCEKAIIINPDQWLAWKNLGMAFEAMDDVREAANCYARAVKISEGNIGPIIYLRQLVNRRKDEIPNLEKIRNEMIDKAVLV